MDGLEHMEDEGTDDVFLQNDQIPTIAEHAARCQRIFNNRMETPAIVPDLTIMDDQLARFSLWASNMDVYGPLNISLDYRLRFSPTAVNIIHQLLDVIADTLQSLKTTDKDQPPQSSGKKRQRLTIQENSEAARGLNDDPAEDNTSKITEIIGGTITRLFRVSNAVRKSAKANRARKIERYKNNEEANQAIEELRIYTKCYIEYRYPKAPDALRSALVEANVLRLRRLYYQRSHQRRIDLSIQNPNNTRDNIRLPDTAATRRVVRFESSAPSNSTARKMPAPPPAPATNATTARQSAVASSYAKSTAQVSGAKSVLVNNKLSFPPIPATRQCPYCSVIVEFKDTRKSKLWQNHVILDLEPFICVFPHCLGGDHREQGTGPPTFETSKAWSSHMQTSHRHVWECRAPSHDPVVFDQEIQYQEHSIEEHAVPAAHVVTLSSAARRPVLDKVKECPFGDDFQSSGKIGSSAIFSSEALESHVAGHMKEIALLALQKLSCDDKEGGEDVDSAQAVEDNGREGSIGVRRPSMNSLMDDEDLDFHEDGGIIRDADGYVGYYEKDVSGRVTELGLEDTYDSGTTKLHDAVQAGDLGLVKSLIRNGASANHMDNNGLTPFHYAAEKGLLSIIHLLLDSGAEPSWEDVIPSGNILQRLYKAGYRKRDVVLEVDNQVRQAPDQSDSHDKVDNQVRQAPGQSGSHDKVDNQVRQAPGQSGSHDIEDETPLNPKDYTVAWFAPYYIEMRAALLLLDERHDGEFQTDKNDESIYTAGGMRGHNVVVCGLPESDPHGVTSVARLVSNVKRSFPNLRFGLVVEIGSITPNLEMGRDIRLGDVLVQVAKHELATPEELSQNNLGKRYGQDGSGPSLHPLFDDMTPRVFRSAISKLRLDPEKATKRTLRYYEMIKNKEHELGNFTDPGQDRDILYESGGGGDRPVGRPMRPGEYRTRVWYGFVGSEKRLVQGGSRGLREKYRDREDFISVRKEAVSGFSDTIPVGVVYGVCSYGSDHMNKEWQPFAAAMAASYAKTLLGEIRSEIPQPSAEPQLSDTPEKSARNVFVLEGMGIQQSGTGSITAEEEVNISTGEGSTKDP